MKAFSNIETYTKFDPEKYYAGTYKEKVVQLQMTNYNSKKYFLKLSNSFDSYVFDLGYKDGFTLEKLRSLCNDIEFNLFLYEFETPKEMYQYIVTKL